MIPVVVTCCSNCPFVAGVDPERDSHDEGTDPWLCDALGAANGSTAPRAIPSTDDRWHGTPPAWCPLRTEDRVVTIRRPR